MGAGGSLPFYRLFHRIKELQTSPWILVQMERITVSLCSEHCIFEETNRYLHCCDMAVGQFVHSIQHLPDILHPRAWHNPISSYNRWWMLSSAGDENHQPGCTNISDLGMDCAVSLSFDGLEYFSVGIHLLCCKNSGTTGKCYYWIFGKNKEKSPEAMQSCQPCLFYIIYTNSRVVSWITDTHMFNSLWNYSWQRRWFIVSMHWNVFVNNYRIKNTDRLYFWS